MLRESAGAVMSAWEVQAFEGETPLLIVEGETCIAECLVGDNWESVEKAISNARLIAAAPELLDALTAILNAGDLSSDLILMAERAVNKTGGWMGGIGAVQTANKEDLIDNERAFYAVVREERDKLRAFAQEIMSHWPERGIDGNDLQEMAKKHGLLISQIRYSPCLLGGCFCSDRAAPASNSVVVTCFKETELLTGGSNEH